MLTLHFCCNKLRKPTSVYMPSKRKLTGEDDEHRLNDVKKYPKFRTTRELAYSRSAKRDFKTELHIFHGPTGTGKSHTAYNEAKALGEVYFKPEGKWWDGYNGQESVILENFRGGLSVGFQTSLCCLADRYPMQVPIKRGFRQFISKRIYITSNMDIDEMFNDSTDLARLEWRITRSVYMGIPYLLT